VSDSPTVALIFFQGGLCFVICVFGCLRLFFLVGLLRLWFLRNVFCVVIAGVVFCVPIFVGLIL